MALCTRVLVLAEGRLIAEGAPDEIRRNPDRDRSLSGTLSMSPDPLLVLDDVFAGYGKMTILNGTTRAHSPRRDHHRDRPERRRQIDDVQDDLRAAAGAQRHDHLRWPRHHELHAAPDARCGRRLHSARPQYFSRAECAPQSRARRCCAVRSGATCRRAWKRSCSAFRCCTRRRARRLRRCPAGSKKCSKLRADFCLIRN